MWFGIGGGLLKYDGFNFSLVTGYTSILPMDLGGVWQVLIDKKNTIWLTTGGKGVINYDFEYNKVTEYNRQNSPLTTNSVHDVVIDKNGDFWFICGTQGFPLDPGDTMLLVKFDGMNWTVYTKFNSGYAIDAPYNLAIDSTGNIWIGGYSNLQKFDGQN
jgi:streptogramin lyase